MKSFEEVKAVVEAIHTILTSPNEIIWYVDEDEVRAGINCSDTFYWGVADDEPIEVDDIPLLLACRAELDAIDTAGEGKTVYRVYTDELFCARKRKMRPQGAIYNTIPTTLWPLFHSCGPHRPSEFGNPYATPDSIEGSTQE